MRVSAVEKSFPSRGNTAQHVYREVSPAVVGITCVARAPGADKDHRFFGTGTIVDPHGLILTSITVVPAKSSRIRVYVRGGRVLSAGLVATSRELEFALLRIDSTQISSALSHVVLGDSRGVRRGQRVYTLGNAFESILKDDQVAMSAGVVSGLFSLTTTLSESTYRGHVIETDAPINNGMDGGPLLDDAGRLVGVLSLNYSRNRWLGTAVPVNALKGLLRPHRDGWFTDDTRTFLAYAGLELEEVEESGIKVVSVTPAGPADRAEIRPGAQLIKVDGQPVRNLREFSRLFSSKRPGDRLRLETSVDNMARTAELRLWGKF